MCECRQVFWKLLSRFQDFSIIGMSWNECSETMECWFRQICVPLANLGTLGEPGHDGQNSWLWEHPSDYILLLELLVQRLFLPLPHFTPSNKGRRTKNKGQRTRSLGFQLDCWFYHTLWGESTWATHSSLIIWRLFVPLRWHFFTIKPQRSTFLKEEHRKASSSYCNFATSCL